jgi:hypothetical protein
MNEKIAILIVKSLIGLVLFVSWMWLEYYPPPDKDVDGLKTFIKLTLGALTGHMATEGFPL